VIAQNYELAAQEILRKYQKKAFAFSRIGRWWEGSEEIGIVALNKGANEILLAEVKWSKNRVGTNIYEDLKRKAAEVVWGKNNRKECFALFSKSGFTPDMRKLARKDGVLLFEQNHLLR